MSEPEIALAASPRGWPQRLHLHVADHGGARVRATVVHPRDALAEGYDVFIVDDTTSFLSRRLVGELHEQGRQVLGVYDPEDPRGKGELVELGVDAVCDANAPAEDFLEVVIDLARHRALARQSAESDALDEASSRVDAELGGVSSAPVATARDQGGDRATDRATRGWITAVGSPGGGSGATEVAIGLAAAVGARGEACVLVDGDDVAPALAQRLGLGPYPNIRAAVDAVEHRAGELADTLTAVRSGRFWALSGLASPLDWPQLRATEAEAVVTALARRCHHVLVNVGHRLEDLPAAGGAGRYAPTRALTASADTVVGVGLPTPVGVTRLLEWLGEVRALASETPVHLVLNHAPARGFKRRECETELLRNATPASLTFVPADARVAAAAWAGEVVRSGPFARTVAGLAATALPRVGPVASRRRRRKSRA